MPELTSILAGPILTSDPVMFGSTAFYHCPQFSRVETVEGVEYPEGFVTTTCLADTDDFDYSDGEGGHFLPDCILGQEKYENRSLFSIVLDIFYFLDAEVTCPAATLAPDMKYSKISSTRKCSYP